MLPFDNKSEFQVILNMPEGSALERTAQAAQRNRGGGAREPEVTDYQVYVGAPPRLTSTVWCAITSCAAGHPPQTCR